ncbi:uncharacterized protein M6B38_368600 [Iris pallida]|uniref:Uncharacterized protein n=1 Tax=Iris pallida TaxID=29817 RepID=A0AAX6GGG9_IRIPA|nr:uncharacterized protein M6B38_368600 [Iris pallida]
MAKTTSQQSRPADTERSATSRRPNPVASFAGGVFAAALRGAPPPVMMAIPEVAAVASTPVPGAMTGAVTGVLPLSTQRTPPSVAGDLLPSPPLTTDMGQMFALFWEMMEALRAQFETIQQRQADTMRQSMEDAHQLALATVERGAPAEGEQSRTGNIQDFKKLGPWDFKGTEGIVYADDWLEDIECNMRVSRLADDLKAEAVGLQLLDIARTSFKNEPTLAGEGHTLAEFKELFQKKFFSPSDKIDLARQF